MNSMPYSEINFCGLVWVVGWAGWVGWRGSSNGGGGVSVSMNIYFTITAWTPFY